MSCTVGPHTITGNEVAVIRWTSGQARALFVPPNCTSDSGDAQ